MTDLFPAESLPADPPAPEVIEPLAWAADLDDPDDPVVILHTFIAYLEGLRPSSKPPKTIDRDRFLITTILAVLADPHHHIGQRITRQVLRCYIERGGRVPRPGGLAKTLREPDAFDFAVQYLTEWRCSCGQALPTKAIAMALGCSIKNIRRRRRHDFNSGVSDVN